MHTFHASVCVCKLFSHSQRFFLHHIWIDQFSFFFLHMPKMLYTRAYTHSHTHCTRNLLLSCHQAVEWVEFDYFGESYITDRTRFSMTAFFPLARVSVCACCICDKRNKNDTKRPWHFPNAKHTHTHTRARTHNRFYCRPVLRSLLHAFTFLVETKMTAKNRDESVTPLFVSVSVCSTMRNCLYVWVSVKKRSAEKRKPHQECES